MHFLGTLGAGALTTIELTVISGLLGFAVALIAGTAMLSRIMVVRFVARLYTEVFRGASELVILYFFIFALPTLFNITLPVTTGAVIALSLNIGGYEAEVVRGAVLAVPPGQTEAAIALNMSPSLRLRRIIVPQAVMAMLPPINVLTVQLCKATALVSIIGLTDLTKASQNVVELNGEWLRYAGEALIGYYIINTVINQLFRFAERRMKRGRDIGAMVGA
ncbi:MAG: amino acid ABC transporter permease [Marmoricola sp.]